MKPVKSATDNLLFINVRTYTPNVRFDTDGLNDDVELVEDNCIRLNVSQICYIELYKHLGFTYYKLVMTNGQSIITDKFSFSSIDKLIQGGD
ncbi:MAG: hypothetical protein ACI4V7_12380 [Succinivibrionaceae bacterium]